ncbi:MAG: sterol desaturase family protein [Thermoanaerobaculia bacterium]
MRPSSQAIVSTAVIGGGYLLMLLAESLRPLRSRVEPKIRHVVRNFTTGGVSRAVLTLLQAPLLVPVARWTAEHRFGVLNAGAFGKPLRMILGLILMDYTLWWWHRANHQVPFLWRFHLPHHVDLDLDASTALRFHFGELSLSVLYRAAQIVIIGINTYEVWVWQTIVFASILFHHSNARLPMAIERVLVRVIVTPRMHGIHHSDRKNEADSNWANLLSWWDYLHRTVRLDVAQDELTIGVPAYRRTDAVTIGKIVVLPFASQKDDWRDPDGSHAIRPHDPLARARLAE